MRVASDSPLTASPMTSMLRTTASWVFGSAKNASRPSAVYWRARSMAATISARLSRSARWASERQSLSEYFVANEGVQAPLGDDVDLAAQQLFDLLAELHESEAAVARHIFDEQIDVAVGSCLATSERSKDADVAHAVTFAERAHLLSQLAGQNGADYGWLGWHCLLSTEFYRSFGGRSGGDATGIVLSYHDVRPEYLIALYLQPQAKTPKRREGAAMLLELP